MDTNLTPLVTVLMTAFNTEKYISEAIESVLNQTFQDFELLIVDDGSTDNTYERILEFSDPRIRVIKNEQNEGLRTSANIGLSQSRGKYIARLDSDDISLPARLEKQVALMEANLDIGLCGTYARKFGTQRGKMRPSSISDEEIRASLLFENCFIHSSVIIRRSVLLLHNILYRLELVEDYDLYCQLSWVSTLCNIPEILVLHRKHKAQITNIGCSEIQEFTKKVIKTHLSSVFLESLNSNVFQWVEKIILTPSSEPSYVEILHKIQRINFYNKTYSRDNDVDFSKAIKKNILLHQMRATKRYKVSDFVLIFKHSLGFIYKILGYRYASKLLLYTLMAKKRSC